MKLFINEHLSYSRNCKLERNTISKDALPLTRHPSRILSDYSSQLQRFFDHPSSAMSPLFFFLFLSLSYCFEEIVVQERCYCDFGYDCYCDNAALLIYQCSQVYYFRTNSYTDMYYYMYPAGENIYQIIYYSDKNCLNSLETSYYISCDTCSTPFFNPNAPWYLPYCGEPGGFSFSWWEILLIVVGILVGIILIGGLTRYYFLQSYVEIN